MKLLRKPIIPITILVFFTIYALISFVNHYNFRTYYLDLGLYTNAIYNYVNFNISDFLIYHGHFDVFLIIISPLSLIFRSYTLLILQIVAIILGGIGSYKYIKTLTNDFFLGFAALLHFYLFFGVYTAISFDYHSNVIAATLIPWFFLFIHNKKFVFSTILLFLILFTQENMALWLFFVSIGLFFLYRHKPKMSRIILFYSFISLLYFVCVSIILMPALSGKEVYFYNNYSALGGNFSEYIITLFTKPIYVLKLLFTNHLNNPSGDYIKIELHLFCLFSGAILLFRKPVFFIMLIPIFFQKLFHNDISVWGISGHYAIEFAPIITLGAFYTINQFKRKKIKKIITILLLITTLFTTIKTFDNTEMWIDRAKIRIYKKRHYTKNYDVKAVHKALKSIPEDAIVSAQSPFCPHLALRKKLYQFPEINDANYIIISQNEGPYPTKKEVFYDIFSNLQKDKKWKKIKESEGLFIYKLN